MVHSLPFAFRFVLMFVCGRLSLYKSVMASTSYLNSKWGQTHNQLWKCLPNEATALVWEYMYIRQDLNCLYKACLRPFSHTSYGRAALWSSQGLGTVKSTGSMKYYRKRQKRLADPKQKVCDLHLICQTSHEEKQPTWSVVIYLSVCGKWEVDSLNPTLQDALIPFSHLRRWLGFWTDFKKVYLSKWQLGGH